MNQLQPLVRISGLYHIYAAGTPVAKVALSDITLEVEAGTISGIIGITGSGKTTLVQHLNGLLLPTRGTVEVAGILTNAPKADLVGLRRQVGMLFQFPEEQLFERTIFDDVAFGLRQTQDAPESIAERVYDALAQVGLPPDEFAQRSPFGLSGGQMRRVALAGVLAQRPALLVLDEPTAGLDGTARTEFYRTVQEINRTKGTTVCIVSHNMAEVALLADKVCVMHTGRLVLCGSPRQIFAEVVPLNEYGLLPPPLTEVLLGLRHAGRDVQLDALTIEEVRRAIEKALGKG